jgi:hypothetical protein
LVVLILVVLWTAVLTPRLVRHFREGRSQSSIDSFHEQLHLLERTGPKLVEPAHRLEHPEDEAPAGRLALVEGAGAEHATPHLVRGVRQRQSAWERRRGRRRRRDLLLGLVGLVAVTGGLGAMHALHLLWAITGVSALALAGYVALVAYAQMLHADRDAVRPVPLRQPDVPVPSPAWAGSRPGSRPVHASLAFATPAVEVLSASSPRAARAGYPGAWDDDELVSVGRHAAAGG